MITTNVFIIAKNDSSYRNHHKITEFFRQKTVNLPTKGYL